MGKHAALVGWGMYVPPRVMVNAELESMVDTSDEWIRSRTGIRERHIASPTETASSMAVPAALQALQRADLRPEDVELIVTATVTPDRIFPATACLIQAQIGASRAAAFDLNAACSGFIYALATAYQFIAAGTFRNALVVGSDIYSRIVDWEDRSTCVLFGDGAGAVVLQATEEPLGPLSLVLGSDGSGADLLYVPSPTGPKTSQDGNGRYYLAMNGPEVYRFAVEILAQAVQQAMTLAGLRAEDIDLFIPHQANERIIFSASQRLGLPAEKVFVNVDRYGNTSAASIPIAVCEAAEGGRIPAGGHVVLVGFGGGLSWGATVVRWGRPGDKPRQADA